MQRRQITLPDGRYLIFYTFAETAADEPRAADALERAAEPAPQPQTQAEEERHV